VHANGGVTRKIKKRRNTKAKRGHPRQRGPLGDGRLEGAANCNDCGYRKHHYLRGNSEVVTIGIFEPNEKRICLLGKFSHVEWAQHPENKEQGEVKGQGTVRNLLQRQHPVKSKGLRIKDNNRTRGYHLNEDGGSRLVLVFVFLSGKKREKTATQRETVGRGGVPQIAWS